MNISARLLYGNSVSQNQPPQQNTGVAVRLKGTHNNKPSVFTLDSDTLSKHTILIGGTGCGKTTLFYHFVSQIKATMTKEDVMIIFDSKGDFYSKFFKQATDVVIGNSRQYASSSEKWNIYKEILAEAMKNVTLS
jgi:predicted ATPase